MHSSVARSSVAHPPLAQSSVAQSSAGARRKPGRPKDAARTARRSAEILGAATAIFAERGYAATDLQLVAARLGVGKGTVYRHFGAKETLFLAAVDRGMNLLREAVESATRAAPSPLDRVRLAVHAYLKFFDEHPEQIELLIQERAHFRDRQTPTYFAHQQDDLKPWRELFRDMIRSGEVREVPVERITDVLSDLVYGTMFTTYFAGRRKPLARQCADLLDIVFHGILADPPRPRNSVRTSIRKATNKTTNKRR